MNRRNACSLIASAGLLSLVAGNTCAWATEPFTDFEGRVVNFSDQIPQDRWLVVMIWSHLCPVCAKEMAGQAQLHERHRDGNLALMGLSLDGADATMEAWAFTEEHGVTFPNLIGEAQDVVEFYTRQSGLAFRGTPTFLLYAPAGVLKAVHAGALPPGAIEAFIDGEQKEHN